VVSPESLSLVVHCRLHHGAGRNHAARRLSGSHASAGSLWESSGQLFTTIMGGDYWRLYRIDSGSYQEVIIDGFEIVVNEALHGCGSGFESVPQHRRHD
jgi:hypothetical protein